MRLNVKRVLVVGLGHVGKPLLKIVKGVYEAEGLDLYHREDLLDFKPDVLHICYPWTEAFLAATNEYVTLFDPKLVLIESTVPPYTTQTVAKWNKIPLCHSPVRGRKADGWGWCFNAYTKFIGPVLPEYGRAAARYYQSLGFKTRVCRSPLETEFMKLFSTTYYGLLISWFQEVHRICTAFGVRESEVVEFIRTDETESGGLHRRPTFFPGVIGGHCVIPNAEMLNDVLRFHEHRSSRFIEALLESNKKRKEELDGEKAGRRRR